MRIGKNEKKQLKLVEDWNAKHPAGIDVIVKKDNQTEQRTKTRSAAYMLGASGDYPGHTAVIMLDGISGCYALERVRPLNILQDSDDPLIVKVGDLIEQKRPLEEIVHAAKIAVEQKQLMGEMEAKP